MSPRRIVLDANILIRAVLGSRVPELIAEYAVDVTFYAPELAFTEAARHLPTIASKRGIDTTPLLESLGLLEVILESVPAEVTNPYEAAALARIGPRDPMDWPIVAAALALGCPIWTEDKDFFGTGVPTWTSDRVEIYLRGD